MGPEEGPPQKILMALPFQLSFLVENKDPEKYILICFSKNYSMHRRILTFITGPLNILKCIQLVEFCYPGGLFNPPEGWETAVERGNQNWHLN